MEYEVSFCTTCHKVVCIECGKCNMCIYEAENAGSENPTDIEDMIIRAELIINKANSRVP